MKKIIPHILWVGQIALGCALFGLGMNLFLFPSELTPGGISGLAQIVHHLVGFPSVGVISLMINLPLFLAGGRRIGMKFFVGSLIGTVFLSAFIDLFALIPAPQSEPLMAALYGGVLCGLGAGVVFSSGGSTGGSDIIVRLLKQKFRDLPLGYITISFDFVVAALTGIVFGDINKALYSLIAIFVTGQVLDAFLYHFDYSKLAIIISGKHEAIAEGISTQIDRGVTFLYGQGYYSGQDTKVIMTAVKKNQLSELTELVVSIDPEAFIIVQEAHQVLGNRFKKYSTDAL